MSPNAILFRDIHLIQSEVRVRNGMGIPVYRTESVSLFVILKDRRVKNIMLKDSL
jgi:hypothetical protein